MLSKAAGVLALNSLSVHSAAVNSARSDHGVCAINTFVVSPQFGEPPAAELLRQQFILALGGELDVMAALEKRERDAAQYGTGRAGEHKQAVPIPATAPPVILWHPGGHEGGEAGVDRVEVRTTDRTGLLATLTAVFERAGCDISWAKITTLGSSVVDVFAISAPDTAAARDAVERELVAVLPAPPPQPAQEAG